MLQPSGNKTIRWTMNGKPYVYALTPRDVLTWARAIEHEGYPENAVAFTLLQRFAYLKGLGGPYKTLADLVEAYAQPINPRWFPEGDKHLAEVRRLEKKGDVAGANQERERARRRLQKAKVPWNKLSPKTQNIVRGILAGLYKSPAPTAVHYWASRAPKGVSETEAKRINAEKKPGLELLDIGVGFGPGRNVFFTSRNLSGFAGLAGKFALLGAALFGALGYLAYRAWG